MITVPATIATGGTITIDLYEVWQWHWSRAWKDLGRLVSMRENEEHIPTHEPLRFHDGVVGFCECFNCRVVTAWQKRHEVISVKRKTRP